MRSSFVSIFRALCSALHSPSCSLQPVVLFYDFLLDFTRLEGLFIVFFVVPVCSVRVALGRTANIRVLVHCFRYIPEYRLQFLCCDQSVIYCIIWSLFVVGLLPFAAVRVLLAATGSVQSFQFFGVYCATTSMIRVDGRLRCCSPASFRFFVHCVVMVRVVLYSLPCCFTTSIRLQRVFFVIRPVYLTSLLAINMIKTYLCCIAQIRKLSWHHGLRYRKCISTTIDNFSLRIHPYSSVVPFNLVLRIQFLQSHCYNTLYIHQHSSNMSFNRPTFSTPP